jgi:1,5-anhydro-D-fructose reductase (1,5-anhydro-D-mannitol-forming)
MTRKNISSKGTRALRIGVVGAGEVVEQRLLPALSGIPEAELWSVASRTYDKALVVAEKFNARAPISAYSSLVLQLCDPELDAIIIAVPDALHADMAVMAARAGKHIFVEKPLATTSAEAQRIIAAAEEARVTLATGYHLRHHAGHRALKSALMRGKIGALKHVRIAWTYQAPENDWRKAGDAGAWWALAAVGTHAIDLAGWLAVESELPVSALVQKYAEHGEHEHTAKLLLSFASGFSMDIFVSNREVRKRSIELFGTKGYASAVDTLGAYGRGEIAINGKPLAFAPVDPYEAELRDFIRAIRERTAPRVSGANALWDIECLESLDKGATS